LQAPGQQALTSLCATAGKGRAQSELSPFLNLPAENDEGKMKADSRSSRRVVNCREWLVEAKQTGRPPGIEGQKTLMDWAEELEQMVCGERLALVP
jgi:hypothetical protein